MFDLSKGPIELDPEEQLKAITTPYTNVPVDRFTANCQFYFEQAGAQPIQRSLVLSEVYVHCEEEPYVRAVSVGEDWKNLDLGWMSELPIGIIIIHNTMGQGDMVRLDEAALAARKKQILEVGNEQLSFLVRPGHFILLEPSDAKKLKLRSKSGTIRVHTFVSPGGEPI